MKDKKHLIHIAKISLVIQFLWPIVGIMDVVGAVSVPAEILFALLALNMVLAVTGIICFHYFQKKVKEEEEYTKQQVAKELEKAKKREEEWKQLVEKEEKTIKKLQKASRKKQRGKNKDNSEALLRQNPATKEKKEVYPYKQAGENSAKFITEKAEKKSDVNKVLIVDDSITNLKLLSAFLKKMNIEACLARSGKEAVEAVQREEFALILMDHMMKGKNGLDTVKEIRQLKGEYYQNIPVVDVLSMGMEQYEAMSNTEYYQAYLTKPIDYEMLQQVMLTYGVCAEA